MTNKSLKFNLQLSAAESEIIINNLDIDFNIYKNNKPEANCAYINIWNLNDTTFQSLTEKDNLIDVYTSFGEDEPALLFRGYLEHGKVFRGRPQNRVDISTFLTLKDGKKAFSTYINQNYREKVSSTKLIQDCIAAMGIGLGCLSENLPQTQFDNYKAAGYPQSILEKICTPLGITFSVQNNLIQVISPSEKFSGGETLVFNKENAAILQRKGTNEMIISTSLTPALNPNDWIQCDFEELKGTVRIREVHHCGNNYGKACTTEITIGFKDNE